MFYVLASLMFAAVAEATRARYLMGTVCEMTAPPAVIEPAFREADRVEKFLSTWRPDSELRPSQPLRCEKSGTPPAGRQG